MRHALRAADPSALYPDVFFRRFGNDIELSWTARQPDFAPDGFRFVLEPGAAILPVADVAGPLWEALNWFVSTAPLSPAEERAAVAHLDAAIMELRHLPSTSLEEGFLCDIVLRWIQEARQSGRLFDRSVRMTTVPAIERLDDPVLMFGGVSPEIGASDANALLDLIATQSGGTDESSLSGHVDPTIGPPLTAPHEEGYDLAEALLDAVHLPKADESFIAVEQMIEAFGIKVVERALDTDTIRGVALAGDHYAPAILVNLTSPYNTTESGRRFTLTHELFHILYDRTRARRIAHTSGPWAAPGVEKRANAFAAMFLMPRTLVRQALRQPPWTYADVAEAADALKVGPGALIEHLHNIDLIDIVERERLRAGLQRSASRRKGSTPRKAKPPRNP